MPTTATEAKTNAPEGFRPLDDSGVPRIWQHVLLACGCALASGFGVFVAPGVCALLRRLSRSGDLRGRGREGRAPDDEGARAG